MKFLALLVLTLILIFFTKLVDAKTRSVNVGVDQVVDVKTALGIATKVLLDENPISSPIIGDLSAFRIEIIENGYAIKPLRFGAKTNLFISTKDRSYIVRLLTTIQDQADYVVYLKPKELKSLNTIIQYRDFKRLKKENEILLIVKKIGITSDGYIVIDFSLSSSSEQIISFDKFKIKQGKSFKTIHNLILSQRRSTSEKPISGWLTINQADLDKGIPITMEIQTLDQNKYLKMEIPKEVLWKN